MTAVYCDTSVVVAYYVPEDQSERAERALRTQRQRMVSSLVVTEASAALRRKVHDKELSRTQAQSALDAFRRDVVTGLFRAIDVDRRHFDHAGAQLWSTRQRLRSLDALHLAVAELDGLGLLTSDTVMAKAARELGIRTVWAGA
ncbi:MAG TPA: type II toxin-antitoxin system VapC family toxin [Candidatus Limnocylindrales bacterium]|nr:type II toxin-antitoxin system VapC family toxin [Candidatus Limnocylindrales bacterium]